MKKMMLMAVVAGTFAFTSCSKDDDGGGGESACTVCSGTVMGQEIENEYCDNGDGTYTANGVEMELPEGVTYDEFIQGQELILTCN